MERPSLTPALGSAPKGSLGQRRDQGTEALRQVNRRPLQFGTTVNDSDRILEREQLGDLAELVAERIVELLDRHVARETSGLATAAEVAQRLGVRKSWVYANQERLGAIRLSAGPRARLRFDLERVRLAVAGQLPGNAPSEPGATRVTGHALPRGIELLRGKRS